jgi:hypothetical protein
VHRFGDLYLWNLSPAYFLNSPNHPTAVAFKNRVEQAYTAKTGLSPTDRTGSDKTGTKKQSNLLPILALLFLDF